MRYAWTISIFAMGMCIGSVAPGALPSTALFFAFQYAVDRHNLTWPNFSHGGETENRFVLRCLHYLRCIIAMWWIVMGSLFLFVPAYTLAGNWDSRVPPRVIEAIGGLLVVSGIVLAIFSTWSLIKILREYSFNIVDLTNRGLSSIWGVGHFLAVVDAAMSCSCGPWRNRVYGRIAYEDAQESDVELEPRVISRAERLKSVFEPYRAGKAEAVLSWKANSVVVHIDDTPL